MRDVTTAPGFRTGVPHGGPVLNAELDDLVVDFVHASTKSAIEAFRFSQDVVLLGPGKAPTLQRKENIVSRFSSS